jgi:hypothetical protein
MSELGQLIKEDLLRSRPPERIIRMDPNEILKAFQQKSGYYTIDLFIFN